MPYPRLMSMSHTGPATYADADRMAMMARHDVLSLGCWNGQTPGGLSLKAFTDAIRELNPDILISQYTIAQEANNSDATWSDVKAKLDAEEWWTYMADGTKAKSTFSNPAVYDTNLTDYTAVDTNGDRYPQWLAERNYNAFFSTDAFDYIFVDNFIAKPSIATADWNRDLVNELSSDVTLGTKYRQGQMAYITALRAKATSYPVLVNSLAVQDLSSVQYVGQCEAAYFEAAIGETWSVEALSGWDAMMTRYRTGIANLASPQLLGFGMHGASTDYQRMRYGLTSCLLDNGYFSFVASDLSGWPAWFDEFDLELGEPVQAPVTSANGDGVYSREFDHGLVLCNPTDSPVSVSVNSARWKRFAGTQDAAVNSGGVSQLISIGAEDGLILVPNVTASHRAGSFATVGRAAGRWGG